ncbi:MULTISPECIES: MFS transporter [unclassified Brenneria]|uniref:MFS transporter n=1 Tax=unclassified Brenneria TaxID=2634434 RepID=UPI0029C3B976|nr:MULTISPECIES: MFS transporter [unclassified Brenneria]MDX5626708.1 MFS transporter [Brenneria sp. L3-3Z]MDX5693942.1 MFS transporter [Brenneria sp. L4-2C]
MIFSSKHQQHYFTLMMIIAASLVGLITGYTLPLISLRLAALGHGAALLGLISALPAAGMFISSFITPMLSRRMKVKILLVLSLMFLSASTVASCLLSDPLTLILPRLVTGLASGIVIVIGESWIAGAASDRYKATFTGIYTSAFTGFQLVGPLLIVAGDAYAGMAVWSIGITTAVCALLIVPCRDLVRSEEKTPIVYRRILKTVTAIAVGVLCFSFFDASVLSLFPLYGMANGLTEQTAALLVTVIFLGDALLQPVMGWMADKFGVRRVHISCGVIFCILLTLLPLAFNSLHMMFLNCFILGAAAGAIYTLSLVRAGKRFAGQKLIVVNSVFGVVWGAGSVTGPALTGGVVSLMGYGGLIFCLVGVGVIFLAAQFLSVSEQHQAQTTG